MTIDDMLKSQFAFRELLRDAVRTGGVVKQKPLSMAWDRHWFHVWIEVGGESHNIEVIIDNPNDSWDPDDFVIVDWRPI